MAGIDKASIAITMAIVAIALGVAASMSTAQDTSSNIMMEETMMEETMMEETMMEETMMEETMMEETMMEETMMEETMMEETMMEETMMEETMMEETMMEETMMEETMMEETMMEETMMEETMMEEMTGPQTHMVDVPTGTSVPGCEDTNSCYSPADITINSGDTVKWVDIDTAAHTVTSGTKNSGPTGVFDSGLLLPDASWSFTFDETGNYDYFCLVHPWMQGSVTVN